MSLSSETARYAFQRIYTIPKTYFEKLAILTKPVQP